MNCPIVLVMLTVGAAAVHGFGYTVQGLYDVPQELFSMDMSVGANFSQNAFQYFKSHMPNASTIKDPNDPDGRFGFQASLPFLNKYGCWCYRGDDYPGGKGQPQDDYDALCKTVHMAWDCIAIDAEAESETCDPKTAVYTWHVTPAGFGMVSLECGVNNDWCASRTCETDLWFIGEYWNLVFSFVFPNYAQYQHADTTHMAGTFSFDADANCIAAPVDTGHVNSASNVIASGGASSASASSSSSPPSDDTTDVRDINTNNVAGNRGQSNPPSQPAPIVHTSERVCCGDYPFRTWYMTVADNTRRCCVYEDVDLSAKHNTAVLIGSVYNILTQVCCDDGLTTGTIC